MKKSRSEIWKSALVSSNKEGEKEVKLNRPIGDTQEQSFEANPGAHGVFDVSAKRAYIRIRPHAFSRATATTTTTTTQRDKPTCKSERKSFDETLDILGIETRHRNPGPTPLKWAIVYTSSL